MFDTILYLGTTSSWFMNILSWILLQLGVTSLVPCILVWLYVTSSRLYGCALASSWSSHSWCLLFPCVSWTFMYVSVMSSICDCLFMLRSNLFQNFGVRVSPHIPCNPLNTPGSSTSTVSWYCDGYWKRWCALMHYMTPTWWSSRLFVYSDWWHCIIMPNKFV